jgi:sugar O-acyltransferase (sialic acid O-acetyltransferase NeuD family)
MVPDQWGLQDPNRRINPNSTVLQCDLLPQPELETEWNLVRAPKQQKKFLSLKTMLIAGAKGFAKQLLDVIYQLKLENETQLFDDLDADLKQLYQFQILKSLPEATQFFERMGPEFALGIGKPSVRKLLTEKLTSAGGVLTSVISPLARIAPHAKVGDGCTIMTGAVVENDAVLGKGVLVNLNAMICHDTQVGDYCEISPGAILTGGTSLGSHSFIGAGAIINPGVKIGQNVIIGSGSVVVRDIPDHAKVYGVPARNGGDIKS